MTKKSFKKVVCRLLLRSNFKFIPYLYQWSSNESTDEYLNPSSVERDFDNESEADTKSQSSLTQLLLDTTRDAQNICHL